MRSLQLLGALSVAAALASCTSVAPPPPREIDRYPGELTDYRLWKSGPWRVLAPLASTLADVRRILGEPFEAVDLGNYGEPYLSDETADYPLLKYAFDEKWEVFVYFVRSDGNARRRYPPTLWDRVLSVEFLPRNRLPFGNVVFPASFGKRRVRAACATWDDHFDGTGLEYAVFAGPTAHGDEEEGDLNRICYGPSEAEVRALGLPPGDGDW